MCRGQADGPRLRGLARMASKLRETPDMPSHMDLGPFKVGFPVPPVPLPREGSRPDGCSCGRDVGRIWAVRAEAVAPLLQRTALRSGYQGLPEYMRESGSRAWVWVQPTPVPASALGQQRLLLCVHGCGRSREVVTPAALAPRSRLSVCCAGRGAQRRSHGVQAPHVQSTPVNNVVVVGFRSMI